MHTHHSHIGTTPHVWQVQSGFLHGTPSIPQLWLLPVSPLIPRLLASPAGSSSRGFALNFILSEPHMWGPERAGQKEPRVCPLLEGASFVCPTFNSNSAPFMQLKGVSILEAELSPVGKRDI